MNPRCELILPADLHDQLQRHLFPGDSDEHGAVLLADLAATGDTTRILARELVLARDGSDFLPGRLGYRMLNADFVTEQILRSRNERLAYLAIHNHGGAETVAFSAIDLASHERGYPALLDIVRGIPVGALVLATDAIAGDIWLAGGQRLSLDRAVILGPPRRVLTAAPVASPHLKDRAFDRQTRLLGDRGQALLRELRVGVIGAGGVGSLLIEFLARLGVGELVVIDPDRATLTNLPRLVGAARLDALAWLTNERRPVWLRRLGARCARSKVGLARRQVRRAGFTPVFTGVVGDVLEPTIATHLISCDYLFLAADSMQVRLLVNAITQQYLIPAYQVGAKAQVKKDSGELLDVFSVVRPMFPGPGCLWCNGLIPPRLLQEEAATAMDRNQQRYVDDPSVRVPSVITLNAVAAAHAANDFLFAVTGLAESGPLRDYLYMHPRERSVRFDRPRVDPACPECGTGLASRRARGDSRPLPVRATSAMA